MSCVYQWTEDEDDVALDAVTVGVSSDTRILTVVGLQFGKVTAMVYWPNWQGTEAAVEGPMTVQDALRRAERIRELHAFKRVVIWVQHRELWDENWGTLAAAPGL